MKYQVIAAEEKWATTYYHFLQSQKRELTGGEAAIEIVDDSVEGQKLKNLHGEQASQAEQVKESMKKSPTEQEDQNLDTADKKKNVEN